MRLVSCLAVLALIAPARADRPPTMPMNPSNLALARAAHERGDFAEARRLLIEAYAITPLPELLFAIGQEELNLGNYDAAIDFYEKFIASGPSEEQAALAQQAIGAARARRSQAAKPPPPPIAPPPERPVVVLHRRWKIEDTGLVALGGLAAVLGSGLVVYSRRLAQDRSGTLSDYDRRLDNARTTRLTGIGVASAGVLVIGAAVLRWRLRPDGPALTATLTPSSGGLGVVGIW